MFLQKIVDYKNQEVEYLRKSLPEFKKKIEDIPEPKNFEEALTEKKGTTKIIAEIKRASPSKGVFKTKYKPLDLVKQYDASGATAISIVTDNKFFQGNIELVDDIRKIVELPILRKDFIIDEAQIYESRANRADAFLLIAAILDDVKLNDFIALGKELKMFPLVEIHNRDELTRVLKVDSSIIGINNRDLKTFITDINISILLSREVPKDKIIVSESGIETREDIQRLRSAGINTFLIGEVLIKEGDPAKKIKEFLGNDSR